MSRNNDLTMAMRAGLRQAAANILLTGSSLLRLLLAWQQPDRIPPATSTKLLILGTGPSLMASLEGVALRNADNLAIMSVNDYPLDGSFEVARPRYHVIADPAYWDNDSHKLHAAPLISALTAAAWPITLFLPTRARGSRLHKELIAAKRDICFYSPTSVMGFPLFEFTFFKLHVGMPKPQNVLVAAIAIALWMGVREVCLVGADHDWHREIFVDDHNALMTIPRHSYQAEDASVPFLKPTGVRRSLLGQQLRAGDIFTMREIFLAWAAVHDSYERLNRIAKRMHAKIINASARSFIDAFERRPLQAFLAEPLTPHQS